MNIWLKFNRARIIANFLQQKYFDMHYGDVNNSLELQILDELWNHPLYTSDMYLKILWNEDTDRLLWLQVGIIEGSVFKGSVPR
jgi:hypothetical protein